MMSDDDLKADAIDREAIERMFLVEAVEHLDAMEEALVALETRPDDRELLETIFRAAHTIKGNAASLEFPRVTECAHELEDLLQRVRKGQTAVTGGLITLLLHAVDVLRQTVPDDVARVAAPHPGQDALLARLRRAQNAAAIEDEGVDRVAAEQRVRPWGRRKEDIQALGERTKTLRVDIAKLDRMMNLTGEIAIAHGRLRQVMEKSGRIDAAAEAHQEVEGRFMELQEQIMKIRMVPVGPTFRQYLRTVRDVARAHGKAARLVVEGENVEVDTTVIEHLKDPITHMIRNALDHGIESPDRRNEAGKDPCGTIVLKAFHDAGNIVIQLEDDGAGLNRHKIIEKALSRGMLAPSQNPSDEEVFGLVFEAGFSTAEQVTDLSGRGVGMDVVRKNIDAIRGTVGIESREGRGATITIRVPLTLAIIAGFMVGVGDETYVIPLEAVNECLDFPEEARRQTGGSSVINLRGEPLPCLRLREFFKLGDRAPGRESVVVVRHRDGQLGLVVDQLQGESQAVIKSLGRLFQGVPGISGSTILGDGRVALILDVPGLLRQVLSQAAAAAA